MLSLIIVGVFWKLRPKELKPSINIFNSHGWILGIFLFGGYLFQTIGLSYTSPSNAAFITSLSVILVPIVLILKGSKLNKTTISAFTIATIGLALLTINFSSFQINIGDVIVLGTAISVAIQIVLTGEYVKNESALELSLAQLLCMTVLSLILALIFEMNDFKLINEYSTNIIFAILFTALFATVYAYVIQTYSQKTVNPIVIAIIFTFEPIFALLYSLWLQEEVLTIIRVVGMVLILSATFMAILQENKGQKEELKSSTIG